MVPTVALFVLSNVGVVCVRSIFNTEAQNKQVSDSGCDFASCMPHSTIEDHPDPRYSGLQK